MRLKVTDPRRFRVPWQFPLSAQELAAAHNDQAVNSQFLVFLSRGV